MIDYVFLQNGVKHQQSSVALKIFLPTLPPFIGLEVKADKGKQKFCKRDEEKFNIYKT